MQKLILWLDLNQSESHLMLLITSTCLWVLISIFIFFSFWIVGRILLRWIQIKINLFIINRLLKNSEDLKTARQKIKEKVFKGILKGGVWANDNFESFHVAWEEARARGEDKALLPIRVREFLPPEIVLDGARNRRIAEALPGILVALGIFGTFLGLVLGLKGLEIGKLDNLREAVGHLISGLSLAFLTSLFGIAFSIFFSILYRVSISLLERSFLNLDMRLCRVYPYDSQERYARRHYELQADIKQGLQTLATDVATQISGRIGEKLGEAIDQHLIPVMNNIQNWMETYMNDNQVRQNAVTSEFKDHILRLSQVITEHFKTSQENQTQAMESVLDQYVKSLTETFQDQFAAMAKIIEDTTNNQQEIKAQLIEFSDTLRRQLSSQADMIQKTNRAGEILGESLESLETISQKLKSASEDVGSAAKLLEQSATSAKEGQEILSKTMLQQVEAMDRTRVELDQTWRTITENTSSLVNQISHTVQELTSGVGENLVKALNSFDGKVAEVVERFSGTLFEAQETISEMPGIVASINESLDSIKTGIHDQKEILSDIRDTSKNAFAENIEKACEASDRLTESTTNMAAYSDTLKSFFSDFNEKISATANNFDQRNQKVLGLLNQIIESLNGEIRKMNEIMVSDNLFSRLAESLNEEKIKPSQGDRQSEINEVNWDNRIQDLTNRLDQLVSFLADLTQKHPDGFYREVAERIDGINQNISKISDGLTNQMLPQAQKLNSSINKLSLSLEGIHSETERDSESSSRWRSIFGKGPKK